ncbi:MAG TPA: class I SAM-dependent methyltransferase [Fontimonas sp.]
MNWSHGYNVSSGYTYGFYRELAPDWLNYGALLHGYRVPDASGAFRYLELGCGQGFGLCVLAASYPEAEFLGVDFNPEHVAHARELAHAAKLSNIRFEEADFSVLATQWPADFGSFEYVVLHGIYSWVPLPVRQALIRNLDSAMQPGALAYVSYNTLPGWTSAIPLQHLLRRLQMQASKPGAQVIAQGADLMNQLVAANAGVANAYPYLKSRLDSLKSQNPAYLVQEYLHENWHPLWFSQVAEELAGAKLSYVGSATLPENYLPNLLSPQLAAIVRGGEGQTMQQELIDLAINQSFRRDLYCRGPRAMRSSMARLSEFRIIANRAPEGKDALTIQTTYGSLLISRDVVDGVFKALSKGPKTIGELAALKVFSGKPLSEAIQVATLLLSAGHVSLGGSQKPQMAMDVFNQTVARRTVEEFAPYGCLAARNTPTAVAAGEIDMIFYRIIGDEKRSAKSGEDPYKLGAAMLDELQTTGRTLLRDGKPMEIPEERFDHSVQIANEFVSRTLPAWRQLGVV